MAARLTGYVSASNTPTVVGSNVGYGVATGGTSSSITVSSQTYTLLTFTSDGTLTVATAGLFDFLLLAGGGGGGFNNETVTCGGGGGAGQHDTVTAYLVAGTYAVDVGAGGGGGDTSVLSRTGFSTSVAGVMKTVGGGNGGKYVTGVTSDPGGNAANGGGSISYAYPAGGFTVFASGNGFDGGAGQNSATLGKGAGGGGGLSAIGVAGGTAGDLIGGNGGAGIDISAFLGQVANTTRVGGGGGGGGNTSGTGTDGGGNAGTAPTAGTANKGAGGGGTKFNNGAGGAGGSGVVYVRFKV